MERASETLPALDFNDCQQIKDEFNKCNIQLPKEFEEFKTNPTILSQTHQRYRSLSNNNKTGQPFFRLKKKAFCFDKDKLDVTCNTSMNINKRLESENSPNIDLANNCTRWSTNMDTTLAEDPKLDQDFRQSPGLNTSKEFKRPLNERSLPKVNTKKHLKPNENLRATTLGDIPLRLFQQVSTSKMNKLPGLNKLLENSEWGPIISPHKFVGSSNSSRNNGENRTKVMGLLKRRRNINAKDLQKSPDQARDHQLDILKMFMNDFKPEKRVTTNKPGPIAPLQQTEVDFNQTYRDSAKRTSITMMQDFRNSPVFGQTNRASKFISLNKTYYNPHKSLTSEELSALITQKDESPLRISGVHKLMDYRLARQRLALNYPTDETKEGYSNSMLETIDTKDLKFIEKHILKTSPTTNEPILSQKEISSIIKKLRDYSLYQNEPAEVNRVKSVEDGGAQKDNNASGEPTTRTFLRKSKPSKQFQIKLKVNKNNGNDKKEESPTAKNFDAYQDYMLKINFSFNIVVKPPSGKNRACYKYFLGQGNNATLIRSLMKERWWWSQTDKETGDINFMWTQLNQNRFIRSMKPRLNSEKNGNSSNISAVSNYYSGKTLNSEMSENGAVRNSIKTKNDGFNKLLTVAEIKLIKNCSTKLSPKDCEELCKLKNGSTFQTVSDPTSLRMCNHIENNYHLGNKKALLWNMRNYYECMQDNVFNHLPLTFHVQEGINDLEFQKFVDLYERRQREWEELAEQGKKNYFTNKNYWIIKPGENTNRGTGIKVSNSLAEIKDIVSNNEMIEGCKRTYLIQEYLTNPLLYNKRKFDIRCYMMISCINGIYKGYWYEEGYIRTTSKEFNLRNLHNKQIHLTNDAIQKKFDDYGKFEYGNKVSFQDFQKYLETQYDGKVNFFTNIYPQIRALAIDSIKAVYGKIDPNRREHCFEVFGLDFMIDTNFKAWLIEINSNPDITTTSPVLTKIIPNMVENALRLALDPMFPPPSQFCNSKKHAFPENLIENNKFELVFDEVEDAPSLRTILNFQNGAPMGLIFEMKDDEEQDNNEEI